MTTPPTKALTIRDPWAQAIVFGDKRVENRSQRLRKMLGERVAVYVAKTVDQDAWRELYENRKYRGDVPKYEATDVLHYPGHIIGSVRLVGYCDARGEEIDHVQSGFTSHWSGSGPCPTTSEWWQGPVGWLLDDVIEYRPVEARGMPGFWTIDDDTRRLLEER